MCETGNRFKKLAVTNQTMWKVWIIFNNWVHFCGTGGEQEHTMINFALMKLVNFETKGEAQQNTMVIFE